MPLTDTKTTALFSLATVKAWCKVTGIDPSADAQLLLAANAASDTIENETKRYFVTRSVTETFSGDGRSKLFVRRRPIVSVTSLTIGGVALLPTDYVIDSVGLGLITLITKIFTVGIANVVITYTAGFDAQDGPNLPSDIVVAGLNLTKALWDELTTGAITATSVTLGGASMVVKSGRAPSVQDVIKKWVDWRG